MVKKITSLILVSLLLSLQSTVSFAAFPGLNGRIAFHSNRDGNNEIYTTRIDGSDPRRITNNAASDVSPVWSPDGLKMLFMSNRDGNNEIYLMNIDGSNPVNISQNSASEVRPGFSPDGQKIVFTSDRDGDNEIYTMNLDGSGLLQLTNNAINDTNASWSPNGNKIVYQSLTTIALMNVDGTGGVVLSAGNNPDISPDGLKATFNHNFGGAGSSQDVYTINVDGTSLTRLTTMLNTDAVPSFAPENDRVVFRSNRDINSQIYSILMNGTGEVRLTNNTATDDQPDVQPLTISPTLGADTAQTLPGQQVTINVVANDSDAYGQLAIGSMTIMNVQHGSAVANGDGTLVFTPDAGFEGNAQVTYQLCSSENANLCSTAVLGISVAQPTGTSTTQTELAATGQSQTSIIVLAVGLIIGSACVFMFAQTRNLTLQKR